MAANDVRFQARRELESVGLSMESAAYLADDRPPGGWDSLVTKDYLRAEVAELRQALHGEVGGLRSELKDSMARQTRRLIGAVFVAFGLFAGLTRYG